MAMILYIKKERLFFLLTAFALFMGGFFPKTVFAENVNDFSIQPLDEKGEVNQQGYYHFIGQPGEQKAVSIQVFNASEKEIRVNATVNPASTNQNGVPSYQGEATVDSSLVHRMNELVVIEEDTLTVPVGGSATMNLKVSMPNEEWEGDVLGGIRFTQESTQESEQTVVHEVAYTVGILLNQEQGVVVENELTLNEVGAGQRNYRNYIEANLQNRAATIVRELTIESSVFRKGSETPLYTVEAYDLRMAPNSNFDFGIPTGEQPIKAGDYVLKMTAEADGKEYTFEQAFTITSQEARQLNQSAVNLEQEPPYLLYGILSGIVLFFFLLLGRIWHKRKKAALLEKNLV